MSSYRPAVIAAILVSLLMPLALRAATVPLDVFKNVAYVTCGNRRGTGVVTNAADGYVITDGHVAADPATGAVAASCQVGLITDTTLQPRAFYDAAVVHWVFDARRDLDFAVLQLGNHRSGPNGEATGITTDEFAKLGDPLTVVGFPGSATQATTADGMINAFSRGFIETDAAISKGDSGAPTIDANNHLIGIATRYLTRDVGGADEVVTYEAGDVLALLSWLDTFGPHAHEAYVAHADPDRFHALPYASRDEGLGCQDLARSPDSPTLYCLQAGSTRLVFPNETTYFSWYSDFTNVKFISVTGLAQYALIGNVTMQQNSLVKIQTDPKVYVVTDAKGTIRGIPDEATAAALFGSAWAKRVRDVPDTFFLDYQVSEPLANAGS